MKDLINTQIKELYKSKSSFCEQNNHKYKDFASKLRTVETKINWLNMFLKPLKLHVVIEKSNEVMVAHSCTELPNKMVIELSDEEMQIVSKEDLIQMEKEAMEFDGFIPYIVKGKAGIIK